MNEKTLQFTLGLGACLASLFLAFVAIPTWVSSPSNVSNVILSPLFWPYTLAGLTGLTGLGMIAVSLRMPAGGAPVNDGNDDPGAAWIRMAGATLIMIVSLFLFSRLGMVWTSMIAFTATAFLVRTRHPVTALVCAIVIPLALYAFFAHVAGVAIPQGQFVRLP